MTVLSKVKVATILALVLSLGLQWLALQSVAWTTMLLTNVRHVPLGEALARTFDGAHPCELCHAVASANKATKKSGLAPGRAKIDLICNFDGFVGLPPAKPYAYISYSCAISSRFDSPPVPPPRSV